MNASILTISAQHYFARQSESKTTDDNSTVAILTLMPSVVMMMLCATTFSTWPLPFPFAVAFIHQTIVHRMMIHPSCEISHPTNIIIAKATTGFRNWREYSEGYNNVNEKNNNVYERSHIVLIFCDGMGNSILQNTLSEPISSSSDMSSFFMRKINLRALERCFHQRLLLR